MADPQPDADEFLCIGAHARILVGWRVHFT
jgi:hypothetical protein